IMASWRGLLWSLIFGILLLGAVATDSEIVEAEDDGSRAADLNKPAKEEAGLWNHSAAMQVKPYNILEVNCPQGYVLANKHCHKSV
ncbi:hypothetical protein KR018_003792, partial [Drosophila ironensis]